MTPITATEVPENKRLDFLPSQLPNSFALFERYAFNILSSMAKDYNGGFWDFFQLSNGGFYIAPTEYVSLMLVVPTNGYEGSMNGDAAGLVASLFALNRLAWGAQGGEAEHVVAKYHALRDFAFDHPEASKIFEAID